MPHTGSMASAPVSVWLRGAACALPAWAWCTCGLVFISVGRSTGKLQRLPSTAAVHQFLQLFDRNRAFHALAIGKKHRRRSGDAFAPPESEDLLDRRVAGAG